MATPDFKIEIVIALRMIHFSDRHPQYVDEVGQVLNRRIAVDRAVEHVVDGIVGHFIHGVWPTDQ
jgi:hypothetical protein